MEKYGIIILRSRPKGHNHYMEVYMKFVAMVVLALSMIVSGCVMYSTPDDYGYMPAGYGGYGGQFYALPQGYHYEYWSGGPVIVNSITGALITYAALRAMYPNWYWRPIHRPHFVRDWRIPAHRANWGHYGGGPRPHFSNGPRHNFVPGPRPHFGGGPRPHFEGGHHRPFIGERPGPRPRIEGSPRPSHHFGGRPGPRPEGGPRPHMGGPRPRFDGRHPAQMRGPHPNFGGGPRPHMGGPRPRAEGGHRPNFGGPRLNFEGRHGGGPRPGGHHGPHDHGPRR